MMPRGPISRAFRIGGISATLRAAKFLNVDQNSDRSQTNLPLKTVLDSAEISLALSGLTNFYLLLSFNVPSSQQLLVINAWIVGNKGKSPRQSNRISEATCNPLSSERREIVRGIPRHHGSAHDPFVRNLSFESGLAWPDEMILERSGTKGGNAIFRIHDILLQPIL